MKENIVYQGSVFDLHPDKVMPCTDVNLLQWRYYEHCALFSWGISYGLPLIINNKRLKATLLCSTTISIYNLITASFYY